VDYRDITKYPGNVVCGTVNAAGPWGEGAGDRRFVVRNDRAIIGPSTEAWAIFCTDNSASALQSQLGIGPVDASNPKLMAVQRQLNTLIQALEQYRTDNQVFPQTTPGLQSLLPSGTMSSSYLDSVPGDPWGRPYIYEKPRQLYGAPPKYKLYTLGRDGTEGGRGEDADIGNWNLDYINHVAEL
jgi:type II secretion system protein G